MAACDLLGRNPSPTEEEIRLGIEGNLCRCTGYHNIVKAIQWAAANAKKEGSRSCLRSPKNAYVGQSLPRPEDRRFIQGAATYIDDVALPGMLFAAFVRSPTPTHASRPSRPRPPRTSKGPLCPHRRRSRGNLDPMPVYSYEPAQKIEKPAYPCLAAERVRFVGEPVAVVAAADRYSADDVAELVEVDYEPLPVIMDPEVSLKPSTTSYTKILKTILASISFARAVT